MCTALTLLETGNFATSRVETQHTGFLRAEALLFFRVQNSVDEKLKGILMICYENFRRHPYYSTFILGEVTHRANRPRFPSNACNSLHSSPVYF